MAALLNTRQQAAITSQVIRDLVKNDEFTNLLDAMFPEPPVGGAPHD